LANRAGVKGTSGMRKSELIAAIRETRQGAGANGASAGGGGEPDNHDTKAVNNHTEASTTPDATGTDSGEPQSSGDRGGAQNQRSEKKQQGAGDKPARGQQDSKSDDRDSDRGGDQQGSGGQQNRG